MASPSRAAWAASVRAKVDVLAADVLAVEALVAVAFEADVFVDAATRLDVAFSSVKVALIAAVMLPVAFNVMLAADGGPAAAAAKWMSHTIGAPSSSQSSRGSHVASMARKYALSLPMHAVKVTLAPPWLGSTGTKTW